MPSLSVFPLAPTDAPTTDAPNGLTFTPVQSGAFDDIATWGGVVPTGDCYIVIPFGFTVTFTGSLLSVNVITLTIEGTFQVTSTGGVGFAFGFAISIMIRGGGSFIDQTDNNRIYCRPDSIFTFLTGGSFTGIATVVAIYRGALPSDGVGETFALGSSLTGPYTFAVPVDGSIQTYSSIMCLVRASGSFSSGLTWLGGVAPTFGFCDFVGGCDLTIPTGFTLSTASLNGQLNIPFNSITVSLGSFFQLGSPDLEGGFLFRFGFIFSIFGSLEYSSANAAGIFIPFGSQFNFFAGASFSSSFSIPVSIFNPVTNTITGSSLSLTDGYSSPIFIDVSDTGVTLVNTNRECSGEYLWNTFNFNMLF